MSSDSLASGSAIALNRSLRNDNKLSDNQTWKNVQISIVMECKEQRFCTVSKTPSKERAAFWGKDLDWQSADGHLNPQGATNGLLICSWTPRCVITIKFGPPPHSPQITKFIFCAFPEEQQIDSFSDCLGLFRFFAGRPTKTPDFLSSKFSGLGVRNRP